MAARREASTVSPMDQDASYGSCTYTSHTIIVMKPSNAAITVNTLYILRHTYETNVSLQIILMAPKLRA